MVFVRQSADEQVVISISTLAGLKDTESSVTSFGTLPSSVCSEWDLSTSRASVYKVTLSPTSLLWYVSLLIREDDD